MFNPINNTWLSDCLSLLYPDVCRACGKDLNKHEDILCIFCEQSLPKTNFHSDEENPVAKQFWGLVKIEQAIAYYYFHKGSRVQNLIHRLKYKGDTEIGRKIGKLYGRELSKSSSCQSVSLILPVPLHPRKQKARGYNQSSFFAKGLAETMNIPYREDVLFKVLDTATQTRKSRLERRENTEEVFRIQHKEALKNQHILLVDDVLTTGATTESCALALIEAVPSVRISIACMAYAAAQ